MAALFSPSHLFNWLHVHHMVWGGGGSGSLLCRCAAQGIPQAQSTQISVSWGCCAASSCSPSPGDWCGSCWTGTAQGTLTAHHKHPQGFGQAVHGVGINNCLILISVIMLYPYVPGVALWSHQSLQSRMNLRFDIVLQASQSWLMYCALLAGDSKSSKDKTGRIAWKKADFSHQWPSLSLPQDLQVSISQAEL